MENRKKVIGVVLLLLCRIIQRRRKVRRFWVRPSLLQKQAKMLLERAQEDDDEGLSREELQSRSYFKSFTRMSTSLFYMLFDEVKEDLRKQETNYRKPVSPLDR
jgi:hypothetical protein